MISLDEQLRGIEGRQPVRQTESRGRIVRLVAADDIEPVETEFIIGPYVPRGEATWCEGVTKSGKTTVALALIAKLTKGEPLNGEAVAPGKAAIITCEDDPARGIVPRLIAAGADRSRIRIVRVEGNGEECVPSFVTDLSAIEERLGAEQIDLVVVDGTFGMLGVQDSSSYSEAYGRMLPLVGMVRRQNMGAIIVRHVRKSDGSALHRGIGSVGYASLARSTVCVAVDRDDATRRLFAHAGSNSGPRRPTVAFTIEGVSIPAFRHEVGRVAWQGMVELTADQVMSCHSPEDPADRCVAEDFIADFLDVPRQAKDVYLAADRAKLPRRTVLRAAKRTGVTIKREGFGGGSVWYPAHTAAVIHANKEHSRHDEAPGANGANAAGDGRVGAPSRPCPFFTGPAGAPTCERCTHTWNEHYPAPSSQVR